MLEMTLAAKLQFVGFCSQGKIVPKGSKIPASIQPAGLLRCERGERGGSFPWEYQEVNIFLITLLPIIENSAQQDESLIFLIQPSWGQMLWDTLDLYLAKPKSKSELGIILQGKRDRASWDLSPEITAMQDTLLSFHTLLWGVATTLSSSPLSGVWCPWKGFFSSLLGVPRAVSIPLSPPRAGFHQAGTMGVSPEMSSGTSPLFRGHLWSQGHPAHQVQSCPETFWCWISPQTPTSDGQNLLHQAAISAQPLNHWQVWIWRFNFKIKDVNFDEDPRSVSGLCSFSSLVS